MTSTTGNAPIVLIKIGGNVLSSRKSIETLSSVIAHLKKDGRKVVICHGGGSQISEAFRTAGEPVEFIGGLRKTTAEGALIVKNVLCIDIQKNLVDTLNANGIKAIGVCGDAGLFLCEKKIYSRNDQEFDLGFVGEVMQVMCDQISEMISGEYTPVIAAVGTDLLGNIYNINADTGAAHLASCLQVEKLVLLTDVDGLYIDWPNKDSLVSSLSSVEANVLLPSLDQGMAPKLEAAILAVQSNVSEVCLINGNSDDNLYRLLVLGDDIGTKVTL